ncbi:MAG: NADH-quinone oxidoreductase subunit NuoE [Bacteroidales bacterium]|nr:NADH-quinone oxidoreductase subunit NuoE [Bacteroidales bacterium]MDD4603688.1 NADH-quinone oxidoreductase subunit NuoE [Bacteroidales bacterium]
MRVARINTKENENLDDGLDLSLLDPIIAKHKGKKGSLIPILQGTQELFGYISRSAFEKLSMETGIPLSDIYGVATFYAQFRLHPVGKHVIKVCHGTACHVQNSLEITEALEETLKVKDGETTKDRFYTLESVACLGCCSLAPVMMISNQTYGKLTGNEAVKIVKNIKLAENN